MVFSNHIKLLSKIRLHGSGDENKVNKPKEFDGKPWFPRAFGFACYSWWDLSRLPFSPFCFFRHF